MDVLPLPRDRVRVRLAGSYLQGVVVDAYNEGSGPHVTVKIELEGVGPDVDAEPFIATYPLRIVEFVSAPDDVVVPPGWRP